MTKKLHKVKVMHEPAPAPSAGPEEGWAPLMTLRQEMDRLFDDFGGGLWRYSFPQRMKRLIPTGMEWAVAPAVDLVEAEDRYRITVELPGMDAKDVEVKLTDERILIRGEKAEEHMEEKKDFLLSERRYGEFQRVLPLPAGVDHNKVEASFVNGVLTVTLPKSVEAKEKERKVEVMAA